MPAALRLHGSLDYGALARALQEAIERHQPLRTVILENDGKPVGNLLSTPPVALLLPLDDFSALPDAEQEHRLRARIAAEAATPFDLACDLLLGVDCCV